MVNRRRSFLLWLDILHERIMSSNENKKIKSEGDPKFLSNSVITSTS